MVSKLYLVSYKWPQCDLPAHEWHMADRLSELGKSRPTCRLVGHDWHANNKYFVFSWFAFSALSYKLRLPPSASRTKETTYTSQVFVWERSTHSFERKVLLYNLTITSVWIYSMESMYKSVGVKNIPTYTVIY